MDSFPDDDAGVERPRDGGPYLRAWADAHPNALVILAPDLTILWENAAAKAIFEDGRHLVRSGARLACADKSQAASFQAHLSGLDTGSAVWACRAQDGAHLLVRSEALRLGEAEAAIALTLSPADTGRPTLWADLTKILGLTAAESAIAKRLVGGERAEVIARDLGVSLETVRTHIRRIYSKLSIRSREELFSALSPYRLVTF